MDRIRVAGIKATFFPLLALTVPYVLTWLMLFICIFLIVGYVLKNSTAVHTQVLPVLFQPKVPIIFHEITYLCGQIPVLYID
jgi:hypothetical protein